MINHRRRIYFALGLRFALVTERTGFAFSSVSVKAEVLNLKDLSSFVLESGEGSVPLALLPYGSDALNFTGMM